MDQVINWEIKVAFSNAKYHDRAYKESSSYEQSLARQTANKEKIKVLKKNVIKGEKWPLKLEILLEIISADQN